MDEWFTLGFVWAIKDEMMFSPLPFSPSSGMGLPLGTIPLFLFFFLVWGTSRIPQPCLGHHQADSFCISKNSLIQENSQRRKWQEESHTSKTFKCTLLSFQHWTWVLKGFFWISSSIPLHSGLVVLKLFQGIISLLGTPEHGGSGVKGDGVQGLSQLCFYLL